MIMTATERYTAETAVKAGLIEAVEQCKTQICGYYELTPTGIKLQQRKFAFEDKYGEFHVGEFETDEDLLAFARYLENVE